jgi:hypothetical protein
VVLVKDHAGLIDEALRPSDLSLVDCWSIAQDEQRSDCFIKRLQLFGLKQISPHPKML